MKKNRDLITMKGIVIIELFLKYIYICTIFSTLNV